MFSRGGGAAAKPAAAPASAKFFKSTADPLEADYILGEELGRGTFAVVRKGTCRADGTVWAVKCIDKGALEKEDEAAVRLEVAILESVDHPCVVRLRNVYDTPRHLYLVMELCTGGELFDRITEKGKYNEAEASEVVARVADALRYMHARGIVHRDLKPENLLLVDTSEHAAVKIADFGLAKLLNQERVMATACGTPGYVAPEILMGGGYSEKVDTWSLGVILYILLCGFPPFYDESNAALFAAIKAGKYEFLSPYWDNVSADAKDLVSKLLVVDPAARLSAAAILEHPWIASAESGRALGAAAARLKRLTLAKGALTPEVIAALAAAGTAADAARGGR